MSRLLQEFDQWRSSNAIANKRTKKLWEFGLTELLKGIGIWDLLAYQKFDLWEWPNAVHVASHLIIVQVELGQVSQRVQLSRNTSRYTVKIEVEEDQFGEVPDLAWNRAWFWICKMECIMEWVMNNMRSLFSWYCRRMAQSNTYL